MGQSKKRVSRRSFLQKTAGVAAGAAAVGSALKSMAGEAEAKKVDDRPFKLGVIGCGSQAVFNDIPAVLRVPGVTIEAVCDIVPARAQQAANMIKNAKRGDPKIYEDYNELLKQTEMNAVMIITPLNTHHDITLAAFQAGHHVFCEKTMAYTIDQAKNMIKAQMKAGKVLQIGHHLRYHPLYYFAKEHYIDKGLLGRINNIHCQWNRNGTWRRQPPKGEYDFTKWGFKEPDHLWNWRLYKQYSGGLMTELASHQFDIVNWYMKDEPPEAIVGVGKTDNKDGRTIFDNVHLIYEYPNEVQVTYESITTNSYCPFGVQAYEMFQGTRATLIMAHLSRYVGLYLLEPGAEEELWMPVAHKLDLAGEKFANVNQERHRKAIVLNGTPSPGTRTERVGILDLADLVNIEEAKILKTTYEIELINFKACVLDNIRPVCDGLVGMKSAIPALMGNVAMEKQQRVKIDKSLYALS